MLPSRDICLRCPRVGDRDDAGPCAHAFARVVQGWCVAYGHSRRTGRPRRGYDWHARRWSWHPEGRRRGRDHRRICRCTAHPEGRNIHGWFVVHDVSRGSALYRQPVGRWNNQGRRRHPERALHHCTRDYLFRHSRNSYIDTFPHVVLQDRFVATFNHNGSGQEYICCLLDCAKLQVLPSAVAMPRVQGIGDSWQVSGPRTILPPGVIVSV